MMKKTKNKIFSCTKCGNPYEAYPPDDKHRIPTMISEEAKKDHKSVKYICKNCETSTCYTGRMINQTRHSMCSNLKESKRLHKNGYCFTGKTQTYLFIIDFSGEKSEKLSFRSLRYFVDCQAGFRAYHGGED
jgi:hypothetical protein